MGVRIEQCVENVYVWRISKLPSQNTFTKIILKTFDIISCLIYKNA